MKSFKFFKLFIYSLKILHLMLYYNQYNEHDLVEIRLIKNIYKVKHTSEKEKKDYRQLDIQVFRIMGSTQ